MRRARIALLALAVLAAPARAAEPAVSVPATDDRRDLLIEGIAFRGGDGFVSAVAGRKILRLRDGMLVPSFKPGPGTGALLGPAVDAPRGALWAADAWGKNLPGGSGATRTGLLRVLLADGRVLAPYPTPGAQVLDGVAVIANSQWSGWTAEGTRNATDPGPATVALVKVPAHP